MWLPYKQAAKPVPASTGSKEPFIFLTFWSLPPGEEVCGLCVTPSTVTLGLARGHRQRRMEAAEALTHGLSTLASESVWQPKSCLLKTS